MKLKLFKDSKETILDFQVAFKIDDEGDLNIFACNCAGRKLPGGNLACILTDGTFIRARSINPGLGFKLDDQGRLRLAE